MVPIVPVRWGSKPSRDYQSDHVTDCNALWPQELLQRERGHTEKEGFRALLILALVPWVGRCRITRTINLLIGLYDIDYEGIDSNSKWPFNNCAVLRDLRIQSCV